MLDQNTILLISSAITVIGTLGGAIAGVVLTNRHTTKLEKVKIDREKLKRNFQVVEEVYTLLTKIHDRILDNMQQKEPVGEGLTEELNRIKILSHLYLPSAMSSIDEFLAAETYLGVVIDMRSKQRTDEENREIMAALKQYNKSVADAFEALEKLVR